jgi:hypothetical protein
MAAAAMAKPKQERVHPVRFPDPLWHALEQSRRADAQRHPEDQRPSIAKTIRRLVRMALEQEGFLQPGDISDELE